MPSPPESGTPPPASAATRPPRLGGYDNSVAVDGRYIMSLYELLLHNQDPWAGLNLFPLSLTMTVTEWLRLIITQAARPPAHND